MAHVTKLFVLFMAVFVCWQNELCSALRVDISPNRMHPVVMPSTVNISCILDDSLDLEAKYVMAINILGLDGKPIASLIRGSDTPIRVSNSSEFQIKGHMDDVVSKSNLLLTLFNPQEKDAGLYQCSVNYLDDSHILKEKTAEANLTYDKPDVESVMEYCREKISELDTKIQERIKTMETGLINKLSTLETGKMNNISDKDYISAFSARYTISGSEAKGQTIVFNEIIMKEGQGYDEKTGLFTAPKAGIYGFHVVLLTETRKTFIDAALQANGQTMAGLTASSESIYNDQSAMSVLLKLQPADVVKVVVTGKSEARARLRANRFSVFTGYLLREVR